MTFSTATYLFGLLGLMIPIAIHFWSRKETKIRKVGSVRFLPESETSQSSSIQLNEKRLLIIRCLLLALLCLILADLLVSKVEDKPSQIVLIEPNLLTSSMVQRALDTLENEDVRLWQNGFSKLNESSKIDSSNSNHWELINRAKHLLSDTLIVFTRNTISQLEGKRISSGKTFKWIIVDPLGANKYVHRSFSNGNGRYQLVGASTSNATSYQFETASKVENGIEEWDTLHFDIVFDYKYSQDKTYINSALRSIEKLIKRPFRISIYEKSTYTNTGNSSVDWLIWLTDEPMTSPANNTTILSIDQVDFEPLIIESSKGYRLTKRLVRANVVSEDLAGSLLDIIIPVKLDREDVRQADASQTAPRVTSKVSSISNERTSMNDWLWILLVVFFGVERFYSFTRAL